MSQIDSVAATAFHIAGLRASEARRPDPLFSDPYAHLFHRDDISAALRNYEERLPVFPAAIRVRTRWIDDTLARALDEGARQVVVLGAGFDCRALRFARPGVAWFEVDRPELLAYKLEQLVAAGQGEAAVRVAGVGADYVDPGFLDVLFARGLDRARRTFVIWEGNTYYLTPATFMRVLQTLGRGLGDPVIAFDYFTPEVVSGQSRAPGMRAAVPILRSIYAPWTCGIADTHRLAAEAGLRVVEEHWFEALKARYLPGLDLGADVAAENGFCVMARA